MRAAMVCQLVGMARPAVAIEIVGRGDQEPPQRHDRLADDVAAADVARLDADIVAFLDRIVDAVVVMQLDDEFRMLALERADVARELVRQERGDAADAQGAGEPDGERAHRRLRLVEFRDDAHAALEIARARVGRRQPPRRAHQELGLEFGFQLLHALGDDGFGHAEPPRRGGKAAALDDANEHADRGQFIHPRFPCRSGLRPRFILLDCSRFIVLEFENDPFLNWPIINKIDPIYYQCSW